MDLATILGKHNQNWQVLVFLTLLCIVLGFVAKLCRESRCFGVKFYVANHAVLVPHFDAQKGVRATKQLFCRSALACASSLILVDKLVRLKRKIIISDAKF